MNEMKEDLPITVSWHNIVDPKFLTDLLDSKMQSICFKLLVCHVCLDRGWKAHQASSFVFGGVTPSIALLASLDTILFYGFS